MSALVFEALNRASGEMAFEFLSRSCVLFAAGALAIVFLRSRSAEIRHFVCRSALYGILCLPVLQFTTPPQVVTNGCDHVNQILNRVREQAASGLFHNPTGKTNKSIITLARATAAANNRPFPWMFTAAATYAFFTFTFLLRLALGVHRVHKIVQCSEPIHDRNLKELGHEVWLESLSSFRPQIRISDEIKVPMVAGIREFTILLPVSSAVWEYEKLRTALVHEMAHVQRKDPATAFLATLLACVFWIHPLVYWLRRQLAALAEQACDQAALQHLNPEQYARILIEFAADLTATGSRFAAISAVVSNRSSLKRRIERIFSTHQDPETHPRLLRLLLIALSFPVLYLTAVAPFNPLQAQNNYGQNVISIADRAQARTLESELQRDPDNLHVRDALVVFYANEQNETQFAKQTLWLVEHHPEDPIVSVTSNFFPTRENHERLKAAWEEAVGTHSDSAKVLYHAGLFFESQDPQRALDLFTRAKSMTVTDPNTQAKYLNAIAFLYAAAVASDVKNGDPKWRFNNITIPGNLAMTLRADIDTSTDPQFLSKVGMSLVELGDDQLAQMGLRYLESAIQLDPHNPKWSEALESAKAEPIRLRNIRLLIGH